MKENKSISSSSEIKPLVSNSFRKERLQLEAYFEFLGEIEDKKYNTKILYSQNKIDFISLNGEKFCIKMKNKIEKIFFAQRGNFNQNRFSRRRILIFQKR